MKDSIATVLLRSTRRLSSKLKFAAVSTLKNLPIFGVLYYSLISGAFWREQRAVLAGREQYSRQLRELKSTSALLRRNTHRLEKGLIMRPQKPVFASNYIGETVDIFGRANSLNDYDRDELQWSADVLAAFFDAVPEGLNTTVDASRHAFERIDFSSAHQNRVPYKYACLPDRTITITDLEILFQRRRSVRWFQDKPVDEHLLREAARLAAYAPSACNRLPYKFVIANGAPLAHQLAALANGTPGWAHNIPCTVAVVGDLSAYFAEHDRHLIYIDAALASMQFMQACDALGLASCPINWPDIESNERAIREFLRLSDSQRTVMLIAVGYADPEGLIPYSEKKPVDLMAQFLTLSE